MAQLEKPLHGPIFVENPDGSLLHGVPAGFAECTPPSTPRLAVALGADALAQNVDIVRVLARHETLFLSLLVLQLVVEVIFETLHFKYSEDAIFELSLIYPSLSASVLSVLYFVASASEALYSCAFFVLGVAAAFKSRPRLYMRFSTVALVGTLGQLPLAYLNRFNLLTFFLRFISYAYSRFQWNLLEGIQLIQNEAFI